MTSQGDESRPFGTRYLVDESQVFDKNAWDHVPPPLDQGDRIQAALSRQRSSPVPQEKKQKYNSRPSLYWDIFYRNNQNNFFKDRKWLHREFPQLEEATRSDAGPRTILEVGCGAGNAVFPLFASNQNPDLVLHACDFSKNAIRVVKSNPLYTNPGIGQLHASIWDLSSQTLPHGLKPSSVDIIVMVFVLSALHPSEWAQAVANVYTLLKPNGIILLRDYGRHDLTQLRFKEGRMLDDNFYIRGDGTRVYFFESDELSKLFTGSDIPLTEDGPIVRTMKTLRLDPEGAEIKSNGTGGSEWQKSPRGAEIVDPELEVDDEADDFEICLDGTNDDGGFQLKGPLDTSLPLEDPTSVLGPASSDTDPDKTSSSLHNQPLDLILEKPQAQKQSIPVNGASSNAEHQSPLISSLTSQHEDDPTLETAFPFEFDSVTVHPKSRDVSKPKAKPTKPPQAKPQPQQGANSEPTLTADDSPELPPPPPNPSPHHTSIPSHPLFTITQLGVDRRMLVNRKRQLKMYRVWMQGEFRKNGNPGGIIDAVEQNLV